MTQKQRIERLEMAMELVCFKLLGKRLEGMEGPEPAKEKPLSPSDAPACSRCLEFRKLADDAMATLRELTEAWHLLNVLSLNMMDDGPTWPRVLEWLRRNEQFRPENATAQTPPDDGTKNHG